MIVAQGIHGLDFRYVRLGWQQLGFPSPVATLFYFVYTRFKDGRKTAGIICNCKAK